MKASIKNILLAGLFTFLVASPILAVASPAVSSVSARDCDARVLGIPPWYRGLTDDSCNIKAPADEKEGLQKFIWTIVLNVIDMVMVVMVYISIGFILYGGVRMIAGGASPESVTWARRTITNALIGLVIALSAIAIINLLFRIIP